MFSCVLLKKQKLATTGLGATQTELNRSFFYVGCFRLLLCWLIFWILKSDICFIDISPSFFLFFFIIVMKFYAPNNIASKYIRQNWLKEKDKKEKEQTHNQSRFYAPPPPPEMNRVRGAWLAQSVECVTLDLRVVSLSPTLGVESFFFKKWIISMM